VSLRCTSKGYGGQREEIRLVTLSDVLRGNQDEGVLRVGVSP
jgi:hypothetical protein